MSAAAKDLDLSILPPEYRAVFEAQAARVAELEQINRRQEHLIAEMHHALYGKKSEKLDDDDRQLAFEDLQVAQAEVEEQKKKAAPDNDKPKRKKLANRNRGNLPEGLPRIEQVIEPDSRECPCGCGPMHKIGEDRNERLDIVPAQLRVIVTVRPKYACRTCTDGVTQAPTPPWLIEGGLPTEGAIAHVLVSKYADHCPFCDRAGLVNGEDPTSRSVLLSVVGTPPQDANCGEREAPNLYLGLEAPGESPSSSRPSSLLGTSHRHPKVPDLGNLRRAVRVARAERRLRRSCGYEIRC